MEDRKAIDEAETITLTFSYDRPLWRSAMTGWWQSVVPPVPFLQRAFFWAVVWFAIGVLTLGLYTLGIGPRFVLAGLIGAAFLIGVFGYLQRTRMDRFWDVMGQHWDRAGQTEAVFGPHGISLTDEVSRRELSWGSVDAIAGRKGVTVIRPGISMIAVPDMVLPSDLDAKTFRTCLRDWRAA